MESNKHYFPKSIIKKGVNRAFNSHSIATTGVVSIDQNTVSKMSSKTEKVSLRRSFNIQPQREEVLIVSEEKEDLVELDKWVSKEFSKQKEMFSSKGKSKNHGYSRTLSSPNLRTNLIDNNSVFITNRSEQNEGNNFRNKFDETKNFKLKYTSVGKVEYNCNMKIFKEILNKKNSNPIEPLSESHKQIEKLTKETMSKFYAFRNSIGKYNIPPANELLKSYDEEFENKNSIIFKNYNILLKKKEKEQKISLFENRKGEYYFKYKEISDSIKELKHKLVSFRESYKYITEKVIKLKNKVSKA